MSTKVTKFFKDAQQLDKMSKVLIPDYLEYVKIGEQWKIERNGLPDYHYDIRVCAFFRFRYLKEQIGPLAEKFAVIFSGRSLTNLSSDQIVQLQQTVDYIVSEATAEHKDWSLIPVFQAIHFHLSKKVVT